jgi:hypothetical protein
MRIIYPNGQGGIAVIYPSNEILIEEVALKDVPVGVPFLYVEDSDIPTDRSLRAAWEADFSNPHGYGADYGVGTPWLVIAYKEGRASLVRHEDTNEVLNLEVLRDYN